MSADRAADVALVLFAAGVVTTFGVRTWVHWRRTGASGFSGISGPAWSGGWWGGVLFVAALLSAAVGLMLASIAGSICCSAATPERWPAGMERAM